MEHNIYIGSYNQEPYGPNNPQGIYLCKMDADSGALKMVTGFEAGPNPAFLAVHPNGKFLYAGNELVEGRASAYAIESTTQRLTLLNSQPVQGADPCYVSLDPSGRWLLVACYSSGNLAVLPIDSDGKLGPLAERVQHQGKGPNEQRQEKAHAHSIRFDPSGRFALAADLGMDRVWVYRLNERSGKLTPNTPSGLDGKPGAGPRHLEFHITNKFLYIANELDSTVTICAWDAQLGAIRSIKTLSSLPADFTGESIAADIHITPSGDFLYVSNRGHNSLAAFQVNAVTGDLSLIDIYTCGGNWPRNFAIDPQGKYLLVANQYSGDVISFSIGTDGALKPTGAKLSIPAAVCVKFIG